MAWADNDDLFFDQVRTGHHWQCRVADAFSAAGLHVVVTPMAFRATIADAAAFADEIDLTVEGHPIDVKSSSYPFTTDPYSFPFRAANVDTVEGWEHKSIVPTAVVLVSQKTGAMLVVSAKSKPSWTRRSAYDRVRQIKIWTYQCPLDRLLPFDMLVEWLRAHPR